MIIKSIPAQEAQPGASERLETSIFGSAYINLHKWGNLTHEYSLGPEESYHINL